MGGKIWVIHAKYGSYESIFASFSSCWNNLMELQFRAVVFQARVVKPSSMES